MNICEGKRLDESAMKSDEKATKAEEDNHERDDTDGKPTFLNLLQPPAKGRLKDTSSSVLAQGHFEQCPGPLDVMLIEQCPGPLDVITHCDAGIYRELASLLTINENLAMSVTRITFPWTCSPEPKIQSHPRIFTRWSRGRCKCGKTEAKKFEHQYPDKYNIHKMACRFGEYTKPSEANNIN